MNCVRTLTGLLITVSLTACGDPYGYRWTQIQSHAAIYSLARPEIGAPSGFDFVTGQTVRIEQATATGQWDVALDTQNGQLVLLPPGALGIRSQARLLMLPDTTYELVREAPADTARYTRDQALPVRAGAVYVVRTHEEFSFGVSCFHYGRFTPVEINTLVGAIRFLYDVNPFCSDRRLIPPP
ncbi:MAG: hypothetical protein HY701_10595 [Gemmatimonadetes bacterium]|nr:hypothetical protein [Gemmatimonadota bacterium]